MGKRNATKNNDGFGARVDRRKSPRLSLCLFIAGMTPRSIRALTTVRTLCDRYVKGGYQLRVIDICQNPQAARDAQIVAVPTLIKQAPLPARSLVGNFANSQALLRLVAPGLRLGAA